MLSWRVFVILAAVAAYAVSAQNDDSTIPEDELQNARICSAGKSCYFNSRMTFNVDDKAESATGAVNEGSEQVQMDLVVEISAACDSSDSGWQYFRGAVLKVIGGSADAGRKFSEYPFFFVQNKVNGKIKGVYTSDKESKTISNIKRNFLSTLAKKFNRKIADQVQKMRTQQIKAAGNVTENLEFAPMSYHVIGEDLHGKFESIHDIQATEDGGFTLTETTKYADEQSASSRVERGADGGKLQMKKSKEAQTKVDSKGRVVKIKEEDRATIGSLKQLSPAAAMPVPSTGKIEFKLDFDIDRVDKETIAICRNPSRSLEEFESSVDLELHGTVNRVLDKELSYDEMEDDKQDAVAPEVTMAQVESILPSGSIADISDFVRPHNVDSILDLAWEKFRTGNMDENQMKRVLAAVSEIKCPESMNALLQVLVDKEAEPELRSQAVMSLHNLAGESDLVSEHVLQTVSDIAFSEDPLANDATLLLGSLCESNPVGQGYVSDMRALVNEEGDLNRKEVLEAAIRNAQSPSDIAVSDLETGMSLIGSGSKTFIDSSPTIVGNDQFNIKGRALAKANWDNQKAEVVARLGLDATLLEKSAAIISADFDASAEGDTLQAGYSFSALGKVLKKDRRSYTSKYLRYGGNCPAQLSDAPVAIQNDFEKTLLEFSVRFFVVVKVSVGLRGSIGYAVHVGGWFNCGDADVAVVGGVAPRAKLTVTASASLDAYVASAGVSGKVTLFEGKLPIYGILNKDKGCGKVDLNMNSLSGKIYVFYSTVLTSRKEKDLINWNGASKTKNLGSTCFKVSLGKFLKSKDAKGSGSEETAKANVKSVGQANKTNTATSKKSTSEKTTSKSNSSSKSTSDAKEKAKLAAREAAETKREAAETKREALEAKKETKRAVESVKNTIRHESDRTVDTVRKNGQRGRDQARKSSSRTRNQVRKGAEKNEEAISNAATTNANTISSEAQRSRDTTRDTGRRVRETEKKETSSVENADRRSEKRVEDDIDSNKRSERRDTTRVGEEVQQLEDAQNQQNVEDTVRRQAEETREETDSVAKSIERKEEREEFRSLKEEQRSEEGSISTLLRNQEEKNQDQSNFEKLRKQMRRKVDSLEEQKQFSDLKNYDRELNDNSKLADKEVSSIENQISSNERQDSERRMLRREETRITKAVDRRSKVNKEIKKLGKKFKKAASDVRKQARRSTEKIENTMEKSAAAKAQQDQTQSLEDTVREGKEEADQAAQISQLGSEINSGIQKNTQLVEQSASQIEGSIQSEQQQEQSQQDVADVKQTIEQSDASVQQSVTDNSDALQNQLQQQQDDTQNAQEMQSVENKLDSVGAETAANGERAKGLIGRIGKRAKGLAKELGDKASRLEGRIANKVKSGLGSLGKNLKGRLSNLGGRLKNKLQAKLNAKLGGGDSSDDNSGSDSGNSADSSASGSGDSGSGDSGSGDSSGGDSGSGESGDGEGGSLKDRLKEKAREKLDELKEKGKEKVKEWGKKKLEKVKGRAKEWGKKKFNNMRNKMGNKFKNKMGSKLKNKVAGKVKGKAMSKLKSMGGKKLMKGVAKKAIGKAAKKILAANPIGAKVLGAVLAFKAFRRF